ncbi:MAG: PQQ-binding-like beta-propeller repeat protein [Gammaproteobacteria bacterium]|nr:PQQ-binding-like beta-propeller repeat protein [Gammaproteobacteria bacterium]
MSLRLVLAVWVYFTALCPVFGAVAADWVHYGGDLGATRYSALAEINAENVADLEIAWRWKSENYGPRPERKYSTTPIAIDGILYATAGYRRAAIAIDGATGETLWMYRFDEGDRADYAPRRNSGRGVAFWQGDDGEKRIFLLTPGYHLIALDAMTGKPVPEFADGGVLDLKEDLTPDIDPATARIGASSPPLIVGDVVIVGAALDVGMRPPSMRNVPGHVRGFHARTGKLLWTFHTIAQPGEFGHETWEGDSWRYTGNAAVWAPMSADVASGYVYLPVEAATSDIYGGHRLGDNLFSSTLVCLDAATGERVWHRQIVRHDIWDWDNPTAPILLDVVIDGQSIPAVVQLTKQSFAYAFNRTTGEPLWPMEERAVPQSDVPGERTAARQLFPSKPAPFDRQGINEEALIDFTPELHAEALEVVKQFRTSMSLFSPPSLVDADDGSKGTLVLPGSLGGANWEGGAADPETGMLYIASITRPSVYALAADPEYSDMNYVGVGSAPPRVRGLPLIKPPYGRITAIDMNTGEHRWMTVNGDTPKRIREHRDLADLDIPRTGKSTRAGLLVTKTLLFAGEGWSGDPVFRAHDKNTGAIIVELELPATQSGLPMTFMVNDKQFIVVAVGGPGVPGELVALALPD